MLRTIASWHPFIVHFAVAFTITGAVLDTFDLLMRRRTFDRTAFFLAILSLPFLAAAALSGNLASSYLTDAEALSRLEQHLAYANVAVWVGSATAAWRIFLHLRKNYLGYARIIHVAAVLIAAAYVFMAATRGGAIRHRPYVGADAPRTGWHVRMARHAAPSIGSRCTGRRSTVS